MQTNAINLKEFRRLNSLTQDDLAGYLGVSKGFISQVENGRVALPDSQLEKILSNKGWKTEALESRMKFVAQALNDGRKQPEVHRVFLLPQEARGGTLGDFSRGLMKYECEKIISPIVGADIAMTVTGDSMSPEYPSGSVVLIKKVDEAAFIQWGEVYVLDTVNGPIIKQVRKTTDSGIVQCVSINPAYQPFSVCCEDINGWYKVLMVMTAK